MQTVTKEWAAEQLDYTVNLLNLKNVGYQGWNY